MIRHFVPSLDISASLMCNVWKSVTAAVRIVPHRSLAAAVPVKQRERELGVVQSPSPPVILVPKTYDLWQSDVTATF